MSAVIDYKKLAIILFVVFTVASLNFANFSKEQILLANHILVYFIVGFHFMGKGKWWICLLGTLIVACIDEGYQFVLPYRVGEVKDILINLSGGILGGFYRWPVKVG